MQTLERQPEPEETFKFTPVQAGYIEEKLNQVRPHEQIGYLMIPVRLEEQILYKNGLQERGFKTFGEDEEAILMNLYKDFELCQKKMKKQSDESNYGAGKLSLFVAVTEELKCYGKMFSRLVPPFMLAPPNI